jgi:hypothetical protein
MSQAFGLKVSRYYEFSSMGAAEDVGNDKG